MVTRETKLSILSLKIPKCVLMVLAEPLNATLIGHIRAFLKRHILDWVDFSITDKGK